MCEWGTGEVVEVTMQPFPSNCEYCKEHPEDPRCQGEWKKKCTIDKCIASIVKVLEHNGVRMLASCCGHGKGDGSILLLDHTHVVIPIEFTTNTKTKEN